MPARALGAAAVVAIAMLAAGCSDEDDAARDNTAGARCRNDGEAGPYFLVGTQDWRFKEAVDYLEDGGPGRLQPSLDWYAEYERFAAPNADGSVEGISLSLSGHHAALERQREELPGFDLAERDVDGARALVGTGPDGDPSVVSMAVADDYTLMLLSHGLELEALVDAATAVDRVCQPAWVEAGGQVLDCRPFTEPGCAPDAESPPPSMSSVPIVSTTEGP